MQARCWIVLGFEGDGLYFEGWSGAALCEYVYMSWYA